ncbi:MAG: hypothetical protein HQM01_06740 [Magnetococcales bacterium]|nr:hypothetical protein [Magnetococcales bacterium]
MRTKNILLSIAEQEAMSNLYDLHAKIMTTKSLSQKLRGLLSANRFRNTADSQVAHLRDETRKWSAIRRRATHSRQLALACPSDRLA